MARGVWQWGGIWTGEPSSVASVPATDQPHGFCYLLPIYLAVGQRGKREGGGLGLAARMCSILKEPQDSNKGYIFLQFGLQPSCTTTRYTDPIFFEHKYTQFAGKLKMTSNLVFSLSISPPHSRSLKCKLSVCFYLHGAL